MGDFEYPLGLLGIFKDVWGICRGFSKGCFRDPQVFLGTLSNFSGGAWIPLTVPLVVHGLFWHPRITLESNT
jgi:hypothetical protein